jgi:uncharacterized membrane protein
MSHSHPGGTERGTERIEAFSDGVFAIAITLLILDIKVPHAEGTVDLLKRLLGLWPAYIAYVLSFVMIGIYWANHHYIFKLFERTNHTLNLLNLLLLMFIAFLPLPTQVLGEYMLDESNRTTAATFYAIGLLLPAAAWLLVWLYAVRTKLVDRHLDRSYLHRLTLQYAGSVAIYVVAVAVCLIDFKLGLALCVGLTFIYLLPPRSPIYHRGAR